jgi:hypothetical protein
MFAYYVGYPQNNIKKAITKFFSANIIFRQDRFSNPSTSLTENVRRNIKIIMTIAKYARNRSAKTSKQAS